MVSKLIIIIFISDFRSVQNTPFKDSSRRVFKNSLFNQLKNDTKSKSIISNLIIQRSYKSKEDQPFPKYVNIAFYIIY